MEWASCAGCVQGEVGMVESREPCSAPRAAIARPQVIVQVGLWAWGGQIFWFFNYERFPDFYKYEAKMIGLIRALGHQMGSAPSITVGGSQLRPSRGVVYLHVSISPGL